jgi:hypothetical protein
MTMSSFLLVLFIFILSAVILLRPIFEPQSRGSTSHSGRYDVLLAEKERLYSIIEELDQSLELGKISSEDHSKSRADLLNQAAFVLLELDKIGGVKKATKSQEMPSLEDDELDRMIRVRRETLRSGTLYACPNCNEVVDSNDQFCSHCGEAL